MNKIPLTAAYLLLLFSTDTLATNLWLNISADSKNENIIHVNEAKKGEFRLIPKSNKTEAATQQGWEIVSINANGDEIYRTFVKDSRYQRFEAFSPDTGEIETVKDVFLSDGTMQLILPYDESLSQIKITPSDFSRYKTGSNQELILTRDNIETLISHSSPTVHHAKINSEVLSTSKKTVKQPMVVAIMGDGYTSKEISNWHADAQKVMRGFLSDPLMNQLQDKFQFVRIDLASKDSGITIKNVTNKNTALQTELGCSNIDRFLCVNTNLAISAANQALGYGGYDQILVVANTTHYGGLGYSNGIGTLTMHSAATELALHEFGHSAFDLADEYTSGNCHIGSEPNLPNVTQQTDRTKIKWKHLIDANTPVPTHHQQNGVIGLFEGSDYCPYGKYRPVYNSKMRSLGMPWFAVNEEHIRKVMNEFGAEVDVNPTVTLNSTSINAVGTSDKRYSYPVTGHSNQDNVTWKWEHVGGNNRIKLASYDKASTEVFVPKNLFNASAKFRLTATNGSNKSGEAFVTINVVKPAVSITGPVSMASKNPVKLQANANFDQAIYAWTLTRKSNNQIIAGGIDHNGQIKSGLAAGRYIAEVTASSTQGARLATKKHALEVNKQAQNNDQAFVNALTLTLQPNENDNTVTFSGKISSSVAATSTPDYQWTLPSTAQGGSNGQTDQTFTVKKTSQPQNLTVKVKVTAGSAFRELKQNIMVEAKEGTSAVPAYDARKVYNNKCTSVSHNGQIWQNQWYVNAAQEEPGKGGTWGAWRMKGSSNNSCS